jgi:hypothetical protein
MNLVFWPHPPPVEAASAGPGQPVLAAPSRPRTRGRGPARFLGWWAVGVGADSRQLQAGPSRGRGGGSDE